MNSDSDHILLQKMKTGDPFAFRKLYHRYFQPLFLFACKFVDEEQGKDIVQDCFLALWKNRKKLEITSSLQAYLFTTIKNGCCRHLKKEQQRMSLQNKLGLKLRQEELQFFINSEKSILEFGIRDRVEKVIHNLPEKCRNVFQESRFRGLSNREISEKLNISLKAVEKHITKALQMFRDEFGDLLTLLILILYQKIF